MRRQRRKRHGERRRAVVKRGALEGSGWRWLGPQWMQLAGGEGARGRHQVGGAEGNLAGLAGTAESGAGRGYARAAGGSAFCLGSLGVRSVCVAAARLCAGGVPWVLLCGS